MGPHCAPSENGGFEIVDNAGTGTVTISKGKYYVNGILCENDQDRTYFDQPYLPVPRPEPPKSPFEKDKKYLIYLDVWERHVSYSQDESASGQDLLSPSIREVALMGADTATRSQIVWQVQFKHYTEEQLKKIIDQPLGDPVTDLPKVATTIQQDYPKFLEALALGELPEQPSRGTGRLKAQTKKSELHNSEPCTVSPSSSYRDGENHLYRVEIHRGGKAKKADGASDKPALFKWSRENSSMTFPIRKLVPTSGDSPTTTITLAHLGPDGNCTIRPQDWIEIVDDDYIVQNNPNDKPLFQVVKVDSDELTIIVKGETTLRVDQDSQTQKHPLVRRWDYNNQATAAGDENLGLHAVEEGEKKWLPLESGIEINFSGESSADAVYKKGDYWLIPARTATGDIEWPRTKNKPDSLPPHGIVHSYAPLALVAVDSDNKITPTDCRRKLKQQWE